MAVILAIFGIIHFIIFLGGIFLFYLIYKKENYYKKDIYTYIVCTLILSLVGFFVGNHLAMFTGDGGVMKSVGYTAIPITQISFALLAYASIQYINYNEKYQVRMGPYILAAMTSAPLSLLLAASISQSYWQLLGKSIYG
ncbi:MAG: hypothetical protein HON90_15275 [Halobacteriovoraceae bacterium]|jgi:hypothetical protein|nr:hypothetical protein [Halobacteriovoraceae bacterium]